MTALANKKVRVSVKAKHACVGANTDTYTVVSNVANDMRKNVGADMTGGAGI